MYTHTYEIILVIVSIKSNPETFWNIQSMIKSIKYNSLKMHCTI